MLKFIVNATTHTRARARDWRDIQERNKFFYD